MEKREAAELVRRFGRAVNGLGWDVYIISSDEELERNFGKRAEKVRKLYNGMIRCGYYKFK